MLMFGLARSSRPLTRDDSGATCLPFHLPLPLSLPLPLPRQDATLKRLHEACRLGQSDEVMKKMVSATSACQRARALQSDPRIASAVLAWLTQP